MFHFGSLNHAQDQGINGQTACPLLEGERTYGRHNEIDAIDPIRTSSSFPLVGGLKPSQMSGPQCTNRNRIHVSLPHLEPVQVNLFTRGIDQPLSHRSLHLVEIKSGDLGIPPVSITR